jgi:tRNA modification GTPase
MIDHLLGLLARVEAYIDFPEDDLPPEDRSILADGTRKLLTETGRLLATGHYGQILRHGIKTVILGEPNVGKSSLLNYLVGCDRALVSPEPGTTRDYLEEPLTLGAHCIRLFDTAGLRPSPAPLEQLSITKTLERAAGADLLLLVLDATRPTPVLPPEIETRMNPKTTLIVINKIDLVPNGPYPDTPAAIPVTRISALTGVGCDHLVSAIIRHAEAFRVEHDDDSIAINARHSHALETAAECLRDAQSKLQCSAPAELLASDLRGVLDSFGEICGRIDNNRLLNHIFASFCVGK